MTKYKRVSKNALTEDQKKEIIAFFKSANDNRSTVIAERLNYKLYQVNKVLNEYLKDLKDQI